MSSPPVDGHEIGEGSTPSKRLKTRSKVWEHFVKVGDGTRANCKYCNQDFSLLYGTTTHLHRHLKSFHLPVWDIPQPLEIDESNEIAATNQPSMLNFQLVTNFAFTQEMTREIEVKKAILGNLVFAPLKVREALNSFITMDIEKEIYAYYQKEKEKLIAEFGNLTSRVCFSIGHMGETGWISITAHFINDNLNLMKKLIGFKKIRKLETVSDIVNSCLSDWKLENKIFSFTGAGDLVDNLDVGEMLLDDEQMFSHCSKEQVARNYFFDLKRTYSVEKDQIINLLQDALENCIWRLNIIAKEKGLPPINKDLLQGQPIGWVAGTQVWKFCCSVVEMFKKALLYKDVFCQYPLKRELYDCILKIDPYHINWSKVEEAINSFERIALVIGPLSSFKVPTSNLYIQNQRKIIEILVEFKGFYKPISLFGFVLDPRYKLIFVEYFFDEDEFDSINRIFHSLFRIYANEEETNQAIPLPIGTANAQNEGPSFNSTTRGPSRTIESFALYIKESKHVEREMYQYLMDEVADIEDTNFDLLGWWEENRLRYPVLSRMARDVLAMPVCIYNVEESLNLDLNGLDRVSPELAEAVICLKDWILSDV
jgi:hAT family C-terminal dimerisation region/BED zinc finger